MEFGFLFRWGTAGYSVKGHVTLHGGLQERVDSVGKGDVAHTLRLSRRLARQRAVSHR
jgi:hypothetical protein